ncbi:hypothetical protein CEXT_574071 [Caerostris extrusa]|uniref:Uncharacterized protein n=1 Tax=Caerostris extrusa TaxID=172846 RepID=A0AAV4MWH2_CAEEX|nr:hypothetical protein CEXT_574071 [Caerostris extrusa]
MYSNNVSPLVACIQKRSIQSNYLSKEIIFIKLLSFLMVMYKEKAMELTTTPRPFQMAGVPDPSLVIPPPNHSHRESCQRFKQPTTTTASLLNPLSHCL